jgi:hypothetical protein
VSVLLAAITVSAQRPAVDQVWMGPPDLAGSFQPVRELSGRLEVTSFIGPTNPADLQAVCDERRDAEKSALSFDLQNYKARLEGSGRDEKAFVWTAYILAQVRAYFGQMGEATSLLQKARDEVAASAAHNTFPGGPSMFDGLIGVSELRRGEIENCLMHPNAQRCIFPITGMGRHDMPSGSEHAMASFERALAASPNDLELRWLLNVAAMTVGKYPAGVPARYLIPPDRFASAEDIGQFTDEAPSLGLDHVSRAGGVVMDDFNGDGRNDIAISSVDPCEPLRLYLQQPDGHFAEATNTGLDGELGGINLVQADYNNDGHLDLYVMRGGWENPIRNSLLRNNGDGTFTDVTKEAGLLDVPHSTHAAAWADFDNDGYLDLFVGHERTPSRLYRNRGDGRFEDVTKRAGVDVRGFVKGVAWGDYDQDGYPDLYISNFGQPNVLFHNNGDGTFTDVTERMGVAAPRMSFSTWFFDYDNDGWPDLFVAGFVPSIVEAVKPYVGQHSSAETMKLYRNLKGRGFEDVTAAVGLDRVTLTMGANFGDVDNDGWLDIYLGNGAPSYAALAPNLLFRNHDGRRFVDISTSSGTSHLQKGHGIAIGDLDGDGNEDIFANMGGFVPADSFAKVLFRNPGHHGHWIGLTLTGTRTNRSAIGARVTVYAREAGGTTDRMIPRVVSSGGSFGASPLSVHVGLGTADRVPRVEIYWPVSQSLQVLESPPIDAVTPVTEPVGPEPTH